MTHAAPAPRRAYLDHAATTPMLPEAVAAMTEQLAPGRQRLLAARLGPRHPARRGGVPRADRGGAGLPPGRGRVHLRRHRVRQPGGQGTVLGAAADDARRTRILATAVEHHAVLDPLHWLAERDGAAVELLPVDAECRLDIEALKRAIDRDPGRSPLVVGDVGQQRGRHAPADRRGGRPGARPRDPRAHRRGAGRRPGAGRLRRVRHRRTHPDRAQARRPVRRRRPRRTTRAGGHRAAARGRAGARHPLRHDRRPGDRRASPPRSSCPCGVGRSTPPGCRALRDDLVRRVREVVPERRRQRRPGAAGCRATPT